MSTGRRVFLFLLLVLMALFVNYFSGLDKIEIIEFTPNKNKILSKVLDGELSEVCISGEYELIQSEIKRMGAQDCWVTDEVPLGEIYITVIRNDKSCSKFKISQEISQQQDPNTKCFTKIEADNILFGDALASFIERNKND